MLQFTNSEKLTKKVQYEKKIQNWVKNRFRRKYKKKVAAKSNPEKILAKVQKSTCWVKTRFKARDPDDYSLHFLIAFDRLLPTSDT